MKYQDIKILKESSEEQFAIIGDRHALMLGGENNFATTREGIDDVFGMLNAIPEGMNIVVLSIGQREAIRGEDPDKIVEAINAIIEIVEGERGGAVLYLLFPSGNTYRGKRARLRIIRGIKQPKLGIMDLEKLPLRDNNPYKNIPSVGPSILAYVPTLIQQKFPQSGTAGSETPNTTTYIQAGDRGDAVRQVQDMLLRLGYDLQVDGSYGPETRDAIRSFKYSELDSEENGNYLTYDQYETLSQLAQDAPQPEVQGIPEYPSDMGDSARQAVIRREATLRGIDPEVALTVYRHEGQGAYQSTVTTGSQLKRFGREASYGPFQLYVGNGMGNDYERRTGRDLTTDNTREGITNQIRFALDMAAAGKSWRPWYGFARAYPSPLDYRMGLRGSRAIGNWR